MRKQFATWLLILLMPTTTWSIVGRHDVSAAQYRLDVAPPFLVDLPHEGHGVLIHPQWILTVAHTIFYDYSGKTLTIAGQEQRISKVIFHPNYQQLDTALLEGDSSPLMKFFRHRSDIALIQLEQAMIGAQAISLYQDSNEQGLNVVIIGKGATGNGNNGEQSATKNEKVLRQCENQIVEADGNWLTYIFDHPAQSLALEGMHGSGDSGGPSIISIEDQPFLVGLSSWQYWNGDLADFKGGLYGAKAFQVRVSQYVPWIESVISGGESKQYGEQSD